MYPSILKAFEREATEKIDEALVSECHIQVRHPEYLLETIINLCKKYHELERQEEF